MTDAAEVSAGGKPLPTSARGRRTRQALVDAAREVFASMGYRDATASAITTAAGVSYGSFYVYFSSKADLFSEIARELMDDVYLATRAPLELSDPAARLEEENRRYFEAYRRHAAVFQLVEEVIRDDEDFRRVWRDVRARHLARVARSIRKLQKEGRVDPALDATTTASLLGGMAERAAYLATLDDRVPAARVQATLSRLWANALGLDTAALEG